MRALRTWIKEQIPFIIIVIIALISSAVVIKFIVPIIDKAQKSRESRITHKITLYADDGKTINSWNGRFVYSSDRMITFKVDGQTYKITGTVVVEETK